MNVYMVRTTLAVAQNCFWHAYKSKHYLLSAVNMCIKGGIYCNNYYCIKEGDRIIIHNMAVMRRKKLASVSAQCMLIQ